MIAVLGALSSCVARVDELELALDDGQVQFGDLVALNLHGARLAGVRALERREMRRFGGDGLLRVRATCRRRRRVLARDRLQVVEALDQVGEAVRLQDHRRDVRRRRLVGGDELGDEHLPVVHELDLKAARRVRATLSCERMLASRLRSAVRLVSSADRRVCKSSMLPWKPAIWCESAPMPERTSPSLACEEEILLSSAPGLEPEATEPVALLTLRVMTSAPASVCSARRRRRARRLGTRRGW